jgi:hypothetical protein
MLLHDLEKNSLLSKLQIFLISINVSEIWLFNLFKKIYRDSVPTSQETHYFSTDKINRLMLLSATKAIYCENHTADTDALCEQNAEF